MAEFVTGFQTLEGIKKYDYLHLGNKPDSFSSALKGSKSGTVVRMDDVSPIIHNIGCKIKSKNLFNTLSDFKNGDYIYENATLTLSARYIHKFIELEAGRTYTFSCKSTRTGTTGGGVHIRAYTEDQKTYVDLPGGSQISILSPTVTVTMPAGYPVIRLAFYGHSLDTDTGTSTYTEIMLEEGSEATGYVPYVDPATATVIGCGKNLLDLSRATFTGATYNEAANGITCNINNGYYGGARIDYLNNFLLVNKGKSLTFSIASAINGALISIVIYGTRTDGKTNQEGSATGKREISFPISEAFTEITGLEVRVNRQTTAFTDTTTVVSNMQIEVSETATDFEAFKAASTYAPGENGAVDEIYSLSPSMTFMTDTVNTVVEIEYQRDINKAIKELEQILSPARIVYINILASAWTGGNDLYSQVVNVPGVTKNSQVDLTPSIEQLVIFYNKNLTFVTENVNGVVTVYAIGQKPENDYTMQATVTEVNR